MQRIRVGQLQRRRRAVPVPDRRGAARVRCGRRPPSGGRRGDHHRPDADESRAARRPRPSAGPSSTIGMTSTPGRSSTPVRTRRSSREIGYLVPEPADFSISTRRRRHRDHRPARAAVGRPVAQRALRRQRRQRAVGVALRRALRHGRHRPERGTGPRLVLQPGPRRRGHQARSGAARRVRAVGRWLPHRRDRICGRPEGSVRDVGRSRRSPGWPSRPSTSGTAPAPGSRPSCWCTTACTWRSCSTAATRSARPMPLA